ncbi:MAG: zinc ribbon domain-containing protein [Deltaproteobacteria bacterium]|nr:MAG: zinc ribbon domain-containing protein [Deltaproteobacteria bacterium]
MPIYEYVCSKCKKEFELLVLDRSEKPKCVHCGSGRVKKRPSVFAHRSDEGFVPSSGGSGCSGCSSSSCSGCSK